MATEADAPEVTRVAETEQDKELVGGLRKVEEGLTLAPEIVLNAAKAAESGVSQYVKNEQVDPVIEDKVGTSEHESFLESPSLTKFVSKEICRASEDSGSQEIPSSKENETLKNETKLHDNQTDESVEVVDGLTEGDQVVPVHIEGENINPEDEKPAKSSELVTKEETIESIEIAEGLTEGDEVGAFDEQVAEDLNGENASVANTSELFTQEDESAKVTNVLADGEKVDDSGKVSVGVKEENVKADEHLAKSYEFLTEEKPDESVEVQNGLTEGESTDTFGKQVLAATPREHINPEDEKQAKASESFTEEKTYESVEVTDCLKEVDKVDNSDKEVPENMTEENVKLEYEQLIKSFDLSTEQRTDESFEVTDGFTESDMIDTSGKQAPVDVKQENVDLEDEQLAKSSELFTQKKTGESAEVIYSTEGGKVGTSDKEVPVEMEEENVKPEDEQIAKSSKLITEEEIDESAEVTNSLTEADIGDTFGKQVPVDMAWENVNPEYEKQTKPSESLTEEKNIEEQIQLELFPSPIPSASDISNLQELESLESNDEVIEQKRQNARELSEDKQAAIEEDQQTGDVVHSHLLESPKAIHDGPISEVTNASQSIEEEKAINSLQRDATEGKKACVDLNLELSYETPQKVEEFQGPDHDPSPTPDYAKRSLKTDVVIEGISENTEEIVVKSNKQESFEEIESDKNEGNKNPQESHVNSLASGSPNILNGEAENIENEKSRSEKQDIPATTGMEETGYQKAETEESEMPKFPMTYSLEQRSRDITEKELNEESLPEDKIQDESNIEGVEARDVEDPEHSHPREKSVVVKVEGAVEAVTEVLETGSSTNDKAEANEKEDRPSKDQEKSFEGESKEVQTNNCSDNRGNEVPKEEVFEADKETEKQIIEDNIGKSLIRTSTGEDIVIEHFQQLEVNEDSKAVGEGGPVKNQVIRDVAPIGISTNSVREETIKGSSNNDEVMSHEVCEGLEINHEGEEAEKQIMKDGVATNPSSVFSKEETTNESSENDERAKKHEELKEPEEALEIFEGTKAAEEETIQTERSEMLANASFFIPGVSAEQVKEHILEQDESKARQTSLYISEQEDKKEEETKHDIQVPASVTISESEGQEFEVNCTKTTAENKIEGEPQESSILPSKEQEFKSIEKNDPRKCESLMDDDIQDEELEIPIAEQIKEDVSMQKEEPANLKEANKLGCEDIDKENPNEECQQTEENFQNIETVNVVNKEVPEQSSQKDMSEVENLIQVVMLSEGAAAAASSKNAEDNTCMKEQGSLENLEESFNEGSNGDEGRYTDETCKTETHTEEVVVLPDVASNNPNKEADALPISHLLPEENVKGVSDEHEEVSDIKPEEEIHGEVKPHPDTQELVLETTEMSKSTESANSEDGRTMEVTMSDLIQTSETECMELTNTNEVDSNSKDTHAKDSREDEERSEEQTANAIQKDEVHDEPKTTNAPADTEVIKEELCHFKDISAVSIGGQTINESSGENKKEEENPDEEVPEDLEVNGPSTDRGQETTEDNGTCKDQSAQCSGEVAVVQTYMEQTKTHNHKEDKEERKEQGEVKESELPSAEGFEATYTIKEKDTVITEDGEDSNENPSALSATTASVDNTVQKDNSLKVSEASAVVPAEHVEHINEETSEKADNTNNGSPSAPTPSIEEKLSSQEAEPEGGKQVETSILTFDETSSACPSASVPSIEEKLRLQEVELEGGKAVETSTLAFDEKSSALIEESGTGSTSLVAETEMLEETSNLDEYPTNETTIAGKSDARDVEEEKIPVGAYAPGEKTVATSETEITDPNNDHFNEKSENVQESSMLVSKEQEHESIDMDTEIKDETPLGHEIPNENLETPLVAQLKEEMKNQVEEQRNIEEGFRMGSEDTGKGSLLPESDHENSISKSKDIDALFDMGKTAVLTDINEDGKLDNSFQSTEKNNSEGEQFNPLSENLETEVADTNETFNEKSEKVQESSVLEFKQELGIDIDTEVKHETPSEHEIQDKNMETPSEAQIKEEMKNQVEKLEEGLWIGSQDTGKENLLPESDTEKQISKSKDIDAMLDTEKTAELVDLSKGTELDNSSQCLKENNSGGEQVNSISEELEKVVTCAKTDKDVLDHVENHAKSHDHGFEDNIDECNKAMDTLSEEETEDHGCHTLTTASTKKNDTLAQNLEEPLMAEKAKIGTESVAEDQGQAKLSITEEVGEITTDGRTPSVEDQMAGQSFQNEGTESKNLDGAQPDLTFKDRMINDTNQPMKNQKLVSGPIEKLFEKEIVDKHIIEEDRISTHQVEDETSNKVHDSDIAPVRNFEASNSIEHKEIDTQEETHLKKTEATSPVTEVLGQETLREGDFEKLSQLPNFSEGKENLKEAEDNVHKLDTESVTVVTEKTKSQEAEPEGKTILEASGIGFEEKGVEAFETIETSIKGENRSMNLEIASVSKLPEFYEKIDEKITVEKLDNYDIGSAAEMQKDSQEKDEQINNKEIPEEERKADETNTNNENSKDEIAEAVNPRENTETKDRENQEKVTNEVSIINSLAEEVSVGEVESKHEEALNLDSEKIAKALEYDSQALLQVTDINTKENGNKKDEGMAKEHDTGIHYSVENSFQEDKKTDKQLEEAGTGVDAEENQSEKIRKENKSIQKETSTEEVSDELETATAIENTTQEVSEAEEVVTDPCPISSEKRVNECEEEDKKQGQEAQGEAAKTEPEDQIHEQESDKIQIEKTHEAKDPISYEEVQNKLENTHANEDIEQVMVREGATRDQNLVTVGEEIIQKKHQEVEKNKEAVQLVPGESKPEEPKAILVSEKDQDVKTDETDLSLEKGIMKSEIKEVSEGLEKADACEESDRSIAEETEAFKVLYLVHGHEEEVEEIHQKEELETEKVEEEAPKLSSEYQNQEKNDKSVDMTNEEINSTGPVVDVLELDRAGSSYKTDLVTATGDESHAPPNENAATEEVPKVSKEFKEFSEIVHEEPISEIITTNAPRTETATEDTDGQKTLIEHEELKSTSDLECSSTGESKDLHIKEETSINNSDASFRTKTIQPKIPEIEGKMIENEEKLDLAFASKAIAEVSQTTEEREDNSKNEAPVKETLKNEEGTQDIVCENDEQRNKISKQEETPRGIEILEKPSDGVTDDEHAPRAPDSTEKTETKTPTGSMDIPSNQEDQFEKASVEAEVKDQEYGEASQIESKVKGLKYEGEKWAQDVTEVRMTGSKLSDSDNVPLSDQLQKTIKETLQIAGVNERDPPAKNEETKDKETPSRPVEEQTVGEEEKDRDGEEEEEEEHKITDSGSDAPVMVDASRDIDVRPSPKKSHSLLSGMGSKVKHSIAKVKKAITGKSSHHKQSSPK